MGICSSKEASSRSSSEQPKTKQTPQVAQPQSAPIPQQLVMHFSNIAPQPIIHSYRQQLDEKQWPRLSYPQSQASSSSSMAVPIRSQVHVTASTEVEVEYRKAKNASSAARALPPITTGRGDEEVTAQQPWHPGQGRAFGYYKCTCGAHWGSAYSYADDTQACKTCGNKVLPYKQKPLDQDPDQEKRHKPHLQELCGRCRRLGRLCTLSMEWSKSKNHPNDVVVKGLPLEITDEEFISIFRAYGAILRVYILPPKQGFSNRMGFITFQNPGSALQKFNQVDALVASPKHRF